MDQIGNVSEPTECDRQAPGRLYGGILSTVRIMGSLAASGVVVLHKTLNTVQVPIKSLGSFVTHLRPGSGGPKKRLQREIDGLKRELGRKLADNLIEGMSDPADDPKVQEMLCALKKKGDEIAELEGRQVTVGAEASRDIQPESEQIIQDVPQPEPVQPEPVPPPLTEETTHLSPATEEEEGGTKSMSPPGLGQENTQR